MKTLTIGLLTASLLFVLAGCQDDDNDGTVIPPEPVRITLSLNPDTLWFVAGDTAACEVTVFVSRECCVPLSGVVVHASLSASHNGWLTPANPQQGDTTDRYGEIRYHYYTSLTGTDVLTVTAETVRDSAQIVAAHPYNGELLGVSLFLVPQTIDLSQPGGDTMRVQAAALVRDEWNLPVPGLNVAFTAQLGWLDPPTPTDGNGEAETWWHQPNAYPDTAWTEMTVEVIARVGNFQDSQLILIRQ